MIRSLCAAIAASAGLTAGSIAQNLNIDINAATGSGAGVPILTYPAAGLAGVWNNVPPTGSGPFTLNNFAGNPSGATLSRSGASTSFQSNSPATSGDFEALIDDVENLSGGATTYTISGLLPGAYQVTTYAIAPDNAAYRTNVEVVGAGTQVVGGALADNAFALGVTHALHTRNIGSGQSLVINASTAVSFGSVNGLQLRYTAPARIYVNAASAAVNPTGASWASALPDLQTALAMANASTAATEIWIARGIYKPSTTDRNATFLITRSNLAIYGGFLGTEATLAQRPAPLDTLNAADPFAAPPNYTSLSGDIGPDSSLFDDIKHPVTVQGSNSTLILDGLRITRGFVEGEAIDTNNIGGGLTLINASPTVRSCYFHVCKGELGGAIGVRGPSTATFTGCRVEFCGLNRSGWRGGAVYTADAGSTLNFVGCYFYDNFSSGAGAFYIASSTVNLTNCILAYNRCGSESYGALFASSATVNINNCTIADGYSGIASNDGLYAGLAFIGGAASIRNSIIYGMDNPVSDGTSLQDAHLKNLAPGITTVNISYSTIEGWTGSLGGAGNNGANPRFVAPMFTLGIFSDPIYRLRGGSAMIDSARNLNYPIDAPATDAAGLTRFRNDPAVTDSGSGSAPLIDRGAIEFQGASCRSDVAGLGGSPIPDGILTPDDVVYYLSRFFAGDIGACDIAILGGSPGSDGALTPDDLVLFLSGFFAGCP